MHFKSDTQRLTYAYLPLGNLLAMTSTLKPSSLRFYTTDRNTWDYVNTSLQPARSSTETSAFETCSGPSLQSDHAETRSPIGGLLRALGGISTSKKMGIPTNGVQVASGIRRYLHGPVS